MGRREAIRALCIAVLLAGILGGCAQKKAAVAPMPRSTRPPLAPPAQRPVRKEPPPVALPQVGHGEDEQLKQEAMGKVEAAERIVKQIELNKVPQAQQENFLTVQSFLLKAREALSIRDFLRAFNLADKAQILAEELLSTVR